MSVSVNVKKYYDFYFSLKRLKNEIEEKEFGLFTSKYDFFVDKFCLAKINGRFIPFCEQIQCGRVPLSQHGDLIYLGTFDEDETEYNFITLDEFNSTFDIEELYEFILLVNEKAYIE